MEEETKWRRQRKKTSRWELSSSRMSWVKRRNDGRGVRVRKDGEGQGEKTIKWVSSTSEFRRARAGACPA